MRPILCLLVSLILASPAAALTFSWTGATDGDFAVATNWTTNGVVADAAPSSATDVVINSGSVDITATLDQTAKDFTSFVIGPLYTGTVGNSSGDPLLFGSAKTVVNGGGSTQYLGTGGGNWDEAIIAAVGPNGTDDCYISGTIPLLVLHKGDVFLTSGTITTLILDATAETVANVDLTVTTATITTVLGRNGDMEVDAGTVTTANWDNGTLDVDGGTFTTINQRGGTVQWGTDQTLTTLVCLDGTFDSSDDVRAKTITNITVYTGGTIDLNNHMSNVTLTNGVIVFGGSLVASDSDVLTY